MKPIVRSGHAAVYAGLAALLVIAHSTLPAAAQEPPGPGEPGPGGPPMAGPAPQDMALPGHPMEGHGPDGMHGGGPLAELARAEADQLASQTVANLAHAPAADVQRMIRAWGVPTVLRYYDVPPRTFHDAIVPGLVTLVRSAQAEKQISGADADRIVDRLQHDVPQPPPPQ